MLIKAPQTKVVLSQQLQITFIKTFLLFAIIFTTMKVNASCPKDDISFYLKKGFNHQQIVQLCTSDSAAPVTKKTSLPSASVAPSVIKQKTAPSTVENRQTQFALYGHPDAIFLATAIEGYDVEVTDTSLTFARKECFDYGFEDLNGFQNRACPNVQYSIARGGLTIIERDNGIFGLGSTALYIAGNITVKTLDLNTFKPENRAKIQSILESKTDKLKINVRAGMPQSKVEAILLKLAGQ